MPQPSVNEWVSEARRIRKLAHRLKLAGDRTSDQFLKLSIYLCNQGTLERRGQVWNSSAKHSHTNLVKTGTESRDELLVQKNDLLGEQSVEQGRSVGQISESLPRSYSSR